MRQVPGQITDRLPVDDPTAAGWKYRHEEWTNARQADGYRLGSRWHLIQRRRRRALLTQLAISVVLLGVVIILYVAGNELADELYDAELDYKAPPIVYVDRAPKGVPWCHPPKGDVEWCHVERAAARAGVKP